jgi:hypothetical protein
MNRRDAMKTMAAGMIAGPTLTIDPKPTKHVWVAWDSDQKRWRELEQISGRYYRFKQDKP